MFGNETEEILDGIEERMAELLSANLSSSKQVVNAEDIQTIIDTMDSLGFKWHLSTDVWTIPVFYIDYATTPKYDVQPSDRFGAKPMPAWAKQFPIPDGAALLHGFACPA